MVGTAEVISPYLSNILGSLFRQKAGFAHWLISDWEELHDYFWLVSSKQKECVSFPGQIISYKHKSLQSFPFQFHDDQVVQWAWTQNWGPCRPWPCRQYRWSQWTWSMTEVYKSFSLSHGDLELVCLSWLMQALPHTTTFWS